MEPIFEKGVDPSFMDEARILLVGALFWLLHKLLDVLYFITMR